MITFILNNQLVRTEEPAGSVLLDFIRYKAHLMGTKAGCAMKAIAGFQSGV